MGSVCISSAAILRCLSLSDAQKIVFIVPVVLEFLVSTSLIFFKWGTGRSHYLLVAEGFILALLELFSIIQPPLSTQSLPRFQAFDLGIGITSFLPLFLYTLFLYVFTRRRLLVTLPSYVTNVVNMAMLLSLPLIIATNEVASVSRTTISFDLSGTIPSFEFLTPHDEYLWLFFTSLTLAILAAYQVTVFGLSFFRMIRIFVQQGRPNTDVRLRGIGWICVGIKLGVLEAITGFAGGGFEISIARRVMRLVGRTCLCIGVIMGLDPINELTERPYDKLGASRFNRRRSRMRSLISHPRFSTFRELTPTATEFHSAPRAAGVPNQSQRVPGLNAPRHFFQRLSGILSPNGNGLPGMSQFATIKEKNTKKRVTVLYDVHGGPPLLQMRFSKLEVPSPTVMADTLYDRTARLSPNVNVVEPCTAGIGTQQHGAPTPVDVHDESYPQSSSFDKDNILMKPKPPFARQTRTSGSSRESFSSTSSLAEIVSAPRRTVSQRRVQARVFEARTTGSPDKQVEQGVGEIIKADAPGSDMTSSVSSSPTRFYPTADWKPPRSRLKKSVPVHRHSEAPSTSTKSVSDSIQAVQELASQFPGPPPSASVVDRFDLVPPIITSTLVDESDETPEFPYAIAIGSPTDLTTGCTPCHTPSYEVAQVSQDGIIPQTSSTTCDPFSFEQHTESQMASPNQFPVNWQDEDSPPEWSAYSTAKPQPVYLEATLSKSSTPRIISHLAPPGKTLPRSPRSPLTVDRRHEELQFLEEDDDRTIRAPVQISEWLDNSPVSSIDNPLVKRGFTLSERMDEPQFRVEEQLNFIS